MSSQGPSNPASGANYTLGGGNWSNPGNCLLDDTNYATYAASLDDITDYLYASSYGFTVPSTATIDGIKVEVRRKRSAGSNAPYDYSVKIFKGGSPAGTDKSAGAAWPGTKEHWVTWGGSTDLWGTTWTASDINASGFGFGWAVNDAASTGGWTAYINVILITVYYTPLAGGTGSQTLTVLGVT